MTMTSRLLLIFILLIIPATALAADDTEKFPRWTVELKGGLFYPDIDDWSKYYGSDRMWDYAGAVGYKIFRQVEVGVEGGMMQDRGRALAPTMGTITGNVTYSLWPLTGYAVYRAKFSESQWLVPYAGFGWTRMFYREQIQGQETRTGSADGYTARAGIMLLLDGVDQSAANNLYLDFGISHTYLIFEMQQSKANITTLSAPNDPAHQVNLGGTSFLGGFLIEF